MFTSMLLNFMLAESHFQAFPCILASGQCFEIIQCFLMIRLKTGIYNEVLLHIALWHVLFMQ